MIRRENKLMKITSVNVRITEKEDTRMKGIASVLIDVDGIRPGGFQVRAMKLKNDGGMGFKYSMGVEIKGESVLCDALKMRVMYDWQTKYFGRLNEVNLQGNLSSTKAEDWVVVISLDNNEIGLSEKNCDFNLLVNSDTNHLSDRAILENHISSGMWK